MLPEVVVTSTHTVQEVKDSYRSRLGHQSLEDILREDYDQRNFNQVRLEKTVLALHNSMPFAGEMKVLDETKRALINAGLDLESTHMGRARIAAATHTQPFREGQSLWDHLSDEHDYEEKMFDGMLLLAVQDYQNDLESAYTTNIVHAITAAIESNTQVDDPAEVGAFQKRIREKELTLAEASAWYKKLIPTDTPTPLADRRPMPRNVEVLGFEMNCTYPSNYEIATITRDNCPPVLDGRTIRAAYRDFEIKGKAATVHEIGEYEGQVEIHNNIPAHQLPDAIRHELGHVPELILLPRDESYYFPKYVHDLIEKDRQETGKDIFSSGISSYPLTPDQQATAVRLAKEAIAEIWFIANNDKLVARLKNELPHEYTVLSMFYDAHSPILRQQAP